MLAKLKRAYLITLLTLTALATVSIVAAILINSGSPRWIDVAMMSAVGIGYLLLISFAAYTVIDRKFWCIPAILGAFLAACMMLALPLWAYFENSHRRYSPALDPEIFRLISKLVGFGLTSAGALCLIPFVAAPRMKPLGTVIQIATVIAYAILFLLFQSMIWGDGPTGPGFDSAFTSAIILTFAGTLTTFILNRFFGIKPVNLLTTLTAAIHLRCPRCLKDQDMPLQNARCIFCKLKIKIDIEEPLCPKCGYNLHNLTSSKCPECGTLLREEELPAAELFKWAQANDTQKT